MYIRYENCDPKHSSVPSTNWYDWSSEEKRTNLCRLKYSMCRFIFIRYNITRLSNKSVFWLTRVVYMYSTPDTATALQAYKSDDSLFLLFAYLFIHIKDDSLFRSSGRQRVLQRRILRLLVSVFVFVRVVEMLVLVGVVGDMLDGRSLLVHHQCLYKTGRSTFDQKVVSSTPGRVAIKSSLLGWVTVCGQVNHLGVYPTPRSTQPSIPRGM